MTAAQNLRDLLTAPGLLVCPVVGDPLAARLVQRSGLKVALLGGFGISAMRYGLPDTGLITFTDVLDQLRNTCAAVPGFPIIADGDTGYGNAMNVRRTVKEFARAGAACILIEDQIWPKKCGHYGGGREIIARDEARTKIRAAVEARGDDDILILARTDARSAVGFAEALARCRDFQEEGADIVFAEALQTEAELREFAGGFTVPTWANMMPKTPVTSRDALHAMGFKLVTYNVLLPAAIKAMQSALTALVADDLQSAPPLASFEEVTGLVGLPEYLEFEERYRLPS
ncbi:MAG: carboxyvinyl-carboxyphosphonate phosphorylmutase [Rhodospirillales bacterium]|nr:carboxyvinyl-carboxyphosphonate phosphorylmutase [Rhodospirillales bacterium]